MFWDKKEDKKKLPDLPPMAGPIGRVPTFPEEREHDDDLNEIQEKHVLPAFPDSPSHNRFSEAAIKDAVVDDNEEKLPEIPDGTDKDKAKIIEMEEWKPSKPIEPPRMHVPLEKLNVHAGKEFPEPVQRVEEHHLNVEKNTPDVFVKIDKFRSARKALSEVKSKLDEIDDLTRKIRETKIREERELSAWEKDIAQMKARVENVVEDIFEKVK